MKQRFKPIMRIGGTVMLAPEFRRVGSYLADLQENQPYRVLNIDNSTGRIFILTTDGKRGFPTHCFDPCSCKYALHELVCIKTRRGYSSVLKVIKYFGRSYLLSNGTAYDAACLIPHSECPTGHKIAPERNARQSNNQLLF